MYSNWVSLFDRGQRRGSIIFLEWAGWWDGWALVDQGCTWAWVWLVLGNRNIKGPYGK